MGLILIPKDIYFEKVGYECIVQIMFVFKLWEPNKLNPDCVSIIP